MTVNRPTRIGNRADRSYDATRTRFLVMRTFRTLAYHAIRSLGKCSGIKRKPTAVNDHSAYAGNPRLPNANVRNVLVQCWVHFAVYLFSERWEPVVGRVTLRSNGYKMSLSLGTTSLYPTPTLAQPWSSLGPLTQAFLKSWSSHLTSEPLIAGSRTPSLIQGSPLRSNPFQGSTFVCVPRIQH
jgi:hypothetical protein